LLQIIDISLGNIASLMGYDANAAYHVLTGLEPLGLQRLRKQWFSGTNPTLNDPRVSVLAAVLDSDTDKNLKAVSHSGMPAELADALASGGQWVLETIIQLIVQRFSNLSCSRWTASTPAGQCPSSAWTACLRSSS
jgi:hypothetical protein